MQQPLKDSISIGMVTIGQSRRTDVRAEMRELLGEEIELIECGALDGLTREEIANKAPREGEYTLVTRLKDGTEVKVSREKIKDRMNACIKRLEPKVAGIVLLCTGEFEDLASEAFLIKPSRVVASVVQSLLPTGKLGIVVPSSDQIETIIPKWQQKGRTLTVQALSPYAETNEQTVEKIAETFKDASVDLIVLDCIGYRSNTSETFKQVTNRPVILSSTLVARVVNELFSRRPS